MKERIKQVKMLITEYTAEENGLLSLDGKEFLKANAENEERYRLIKSEIRAMAKKLGVRVIKPEFDIITFWSRTLHNIETLNNSLEETRRQVCNFADNIRIINK
ncbi:MAG: hypothetical protein IJ640_07255 [Prevotella sp.]|nr:hypothetical protein [Prevotella sp.]